jgi:hypothetical protein
VFWGLPLAANISDLQQELQQAMERVRWLTRMHVGAWKISTMVEEEGKRSREARQVFLRPFVVDR